MRIDEVLNQQAVQESQQSTGQKSTSTDDAFAQLLKSEISGSGTLAVSDDISGSLGIQSITSSSVQSPELSQAISAIDSAITQLDSLSNAIQQRNQHHDRAGQRASRRTG